MIINWLRKKAIAVTQSRDPDFVVGDPDSPYLLRWFWIPRNRFFNVYIHRFLKDDEDRALHDHPWPSFSIMCEGRIRECYKTDSSTGFAYRNFYWGDTVYRPAKFAHRIIVLSNGKGEKRPLTIFITGPRIRQWGFHCPKGWRHWKDFVDMTGSGQVGRGCGEMDPREEPHCKICGKQHHFTYQNIGN